jgi:hypothetical protein
VTTRRRVVVDVERIVLEGIELDATGRAAARSAIVEGLTAWLAEVPPSALQSLATARTTATMGTLPAAADGHAVGARIAGAIRAAVAPSESEAP